MSDIAVEGQMFFMLTGKSKRGTSWMMKHIDGIAYRWKGIAYTLACDDRNYMMDIADAAVDAGLSVTVNGRTYPFKCSRAKGRKLAAGASA